MKMYILIWIIIGILCLVIGGFLPDDNHFSISGVISAAGLASIFLGVGLRQGYSSRKETAKPEQNRGVFELPERRVVERWLSKDSITQRELVLWAALSSIPEIGESGARSFRHRLNQIIGLVHPTGDVDFQVLREVMTTYDVEAYRIAAALLPHEQFFHDIDVTYIDDGFAQRWPDGFDELHRLLKNEKQDKE